MFIVLYICFYIYVKYRKYSLRPNSRTRFVPLPSSFAVKSLGLGVGGNRIQSLGFAVRELKKL